MGTGVALVAEGIEAFIAEQELTVQFNTVTERTVDVADPLCPFRIICTTAIFVDGKVFRINLDGGFRVFETCVELNLGMLAKERGPIIDPQPPGQRYLIRAYLLNHLDEEGEETDSRTRYCAFLDIGTGRAVVTESPIPTERRSVEVPVYYFEPDRDAEGKLDSANRAKARENYKAEIEANKDLYH